MQNSKCSMQNCQSGNNKRLTYRTDGGTFGVKGAQLPEDPKLYMCIVKLKDYEDLNVTPDEVERLLEKQTPKKCKLFKDLCTCGHGVFPHMDYCDKCGQALVWRKEDGK